MYKIFTSSKENDLKNVLTLIFFIHKLTFLWDLKISKNTFSQKSKT